MKNPIDLIEELKNRQLIKKAHFQKEKKFSELLEEIEEECGPDYHDNEPTAWKFLGKTVATVAQKASLASWTTPCFQQNTLKLTVIDSSHIQLEFVTKNTKTTTERDSTCSDSYVITDILNNHFLTIKASESYRKVIYKVSNNEKDYIRSEGLHIVKLCEPVSDMIPNIVATLFTLITDPIMGKFGSVLPRWLVDLIYETNYKWLQKWEGLNLIPRTQKKELSVEFFLKNAKSGDTFCTYKGGGVTTLVMWGVGGTCGHIAVLMWGLDAEKDQLFVLQSDDDGIRRETIDQWWADFKGMSMVMYPLSPVYRERFDTRKAWAWFKSLEGLSYGYANFFFGFLDTPNGNYPQAWDSNSWNLALYFISQIPFVGKKAIDSIWTRALNKRLGTEGLEFKEVIAEVEKRGMTLGELIAIPEQADWK